MELDAIVNNALNLREVFGLYSGGAARGGRHRARHRYFYGRDQVT